MIKDNMNPKREAVIYIIMTALESTNQPRISAIFHKIAIAKEPPANLIKNLDLRRSPMSATTIKQPEIMSSSGSIITTQTRVQ